MQTPFLILIGTTIASDGFTNLSKLNIYAYYIVSDIIYFVLQVIQTRSVEDQWSNSVSLVFLYLFFHVVSVSWILRLFIILEILIIFAFMVANKVLTILDEVRCIH